MAVRLTDRAGRRTEWSAPYHFATALRHDDALALAGDVRVSHAVPVWAANATQNYALLRRSFHAVADADGRAREHLLTITAKGVPVRMKSTMPSPSFLGHLLWLSPLACAPPPPPPRATHAEKKKGKKREKKKKKKKVRCSTCWG